MKIIKSSYEILTDLTNPIKTVLQPIENAARICYCSADKATDDSCIKFCKMLIDRGHEAAIEHSQLSVKFTIDRGISHELVRHRLCSFCQQSTRYCNFSNGKFGNEITVILPEDLENDPDKYHCWYMSCLNSEQAYMQLLSLDCKPEIARNVLPTSLATEIVVTANIREWRNIFKLRSSHNICAHPQMRSIMDKLLKELQGKIPVLFDDINY